MIEGWLLYNREDYEKNRFFADRLVMQGVLREITLKVRFTDELRAGVAGNRFFLSAGGGDRLALPPFVLNRTRDWMLARYFEQAGVRVFNTALAARVCNNKIESHMLAARLGLPQVEMVFRQNTPEGLVNHGLMYPVVLKSPYGHGGSEVYLVNDLGELAVAAERIRSPEVIIQRLGDRPGEDVRVYALGGKILTAVKRHSVDQDFRANLSRGGEAEPYRLDAEGKQMAERILQALWLDYGGIDFILDENGNLVFNELEDAVGSRSLYRLGSHDAAALYLDYISETLGSIKT